MTATYEPAAVAETHCAVVLFTGDRAYKMKKPVDLGFLDFRTVTARRRACEQEVRLNSRLAPTSTSASRTSPVPTANSATRSS
jgi:aminoglycoside phosphotransferase family enzyme